MRITSYHTNSPEVLNVPGISLYTSIVAFKSAQCHIYVYVSVNLVNIDSGNGLMPVQHQAIITYTNVDLL